MRTRIKRWHFDDSLELVLHKALAEIERLEARLELADALAEAVGGWIPSTDITTYKHIGGKIRAMAVALKAYREAGEFNPLKEATRQAKKDLKLLLGEAREEEK